MARLNEAPLPTESIDALKRRFIRQNRELAKNNSAQCLRIRSLECEVSRLLADNLNLREEVLRLRSEIPAASTQPRVNFTALAAVKDQLEAKLLDFGSLVAEIGNLQNAASQAMETREPDPSSWRPEVPIAALSGQAQRLSIVGEEKASPGGTLYADIVRPRLEDHTNESPDLGPPPIAHFDCEDPIKFDPKPPVSHDLVDDIDVSDSDYVPASLSVNLQTRRRRRETYFEQDAKSVPSSTSSDAEIESVTEESRRPNKTSTRRRLSMRDASEIDTVPIKDDFVFSRRTSIGMESRKSAIDTDEKQAELPETTKKSDLNKASSLAPRTERKVLGDKSVNMSPQKRTASRVPKDDLSKPDKPAKETTRGSARERKPRNSSVRSLSVPTEPLVDTIDLPEAEEEEARTGSEEFSRPKTPLPDVLSPTPEESATRLDGRDTPPPSAFNSAKTMVSAEINGASRPSRRARAAVNYAEPNLISKMRRPDKTLSDAVTLNGRRSMSNPPGSEAKQGSRTVVIKREESDDSAWNALSRSHEPEHIETGSPLGMKSAAIRQDDGERVKPRVSASGRTIAALMANKPDLKRRREEEEKEKEKEEEEEKEKEAKIEEMSKKMQEMEMYDFKDSSPRPAEEEKKISRRRSNIGGSSSSQEAPKRRVSRVQRQVPGETTAEDQGAESEAPKKAERLMARRRSMMV